MQAAKTSQVTLSCDLLQGIILNNKWRAAKSVARATYHIRILVCFHSFPLRGMLVDHLQWRVISQQVLKEFLAGRKVSLVSTGTIVAKQV